MRMRWERKTRIALRAGRRQCDGLVATDAYRRTAKVSVAHFEW